MDERFSTSLSHTHPYSLCSLSSHNFLFQTNKLFQPPRLAVLWDLVSQCRRPQSGHTVLMGLRWQHCWPLFVQPTGHICTFSILCAKCFKARHHPRVSRNCWLCCLWSICLWLLWVSDKNWSLLVSKPLQFRKCLFLARVHTWQHYVVLWLV